MRSSLEMSNSAMILVAATLAGAALYINLIGAQSFLLSVTTPVYIIYMTGVSGAVFSIFLRYFNRGVHKYATVGVVSIIVYMLMLLGLAQSGLGNFSFALIWMGISIFAILYFKWIIAGLAIRHLNPAAVQSYFVYIFVSYEVGTLLVILAQKFFFHEISPTFIIYITMLIYALLGILLLLVFCPRHNLEINFERDCSLRNKFNVIGFRPFLTIFCVVVFFFGAFETIGDYIVKVFLQSELGTFQQINDIITTIFLISSVTLICVSTFIGRAIHKYRPSPIKIFALYCLIPAAALFYCFLEPSLFTFILFQVILLVTQESFYLPAKQVIATSFPPKERRSMASLEIVFYMVVPNILFAALFLIATSGLPVEAINPLIFLFIGWAVALLVLIYFYRAALIKMFYKNIKNRHKTSSILAAVALSFLNPKDYSKKMVKVLSGSPKKLLRKTVILGLGYKGDSDSIEHIIKEFDSDKEEIQISVLEALRNAKYFFGIEFIIEVLLGMHTSRSTNVRISAAHMLALIYGSKAIPILLFGLHDEDARVRANVLEILSLFKDKALIHEVEPHLASKTPRIKANALMAISRFPAKRKEYRNGVLEMLSADNNSMASCMYAIGKIQDKSFLSDILKISKSKKMEDPMVKRCAAWALTHLGHQKGYDLFNDLFCEPYEAGKQSDFIHLFLQLSSQLRFKVLEYFLTQHHACPELHQNIYNHLNNCVFDFHQEIDFIFSLGEINFDRNGEKNGKKKRKKRKKKKK